MKTLLIAIAITMSLPLTAQNSCSPFYPSQEGKTLVIHQFDKRDRLSTISENTITDAARSTISFNTKLKDKRGKEIVNGIFKVRCSGGQTILEPEAILSPGMLQQYEGMEYEVSGDGLTFPNRLSVGQSLPDGEIRMKIDAGIMNMSMTVTMTDRKVIKKEQITVPAGTFECYVITYTNTLKMGTSKTHYSTQWIARGIGMVKEETKKSNGRLVTRSVLQEIR